MQYNITLRKKDKGWQYIISYKDNNSAWKQKSKQGFNSRGEAKSAAQEVVKDLEKIIKVQASADQKYKGITFEKFTDIFTEHEKLYKEANTILTYKNAIKAFKGLNNISMESIKNIDIQKCVDGLVREKLKCSTIKAYLNRLHLIFNSAIEQFKIIPENPVKNIDVAVEKEDSHKVALTKAELINLLSKIKDDKKHLMSVLAAKCGLRIGEIIGLTWDDIDKVNNTISVNKQWKKLKDDTFGFGSLKSKNSKRIIPIPPDVITELSKYKNKYPENYDKRLFDCKSSYAATMLLLITYKKAGYNISVHELRHTYATTLIANGLDFKTVAKLMGHDVEQTIKTYSHVTDDMMQHAKNLIDKIL